MVERRVTVASRVGLHARPASLFVQTAARQPVRVLICKDGGKPADARSILSVLAMNARAGDTVVLTADGDGADAALDALAAVIATDHDADTEGTATAAAADPATATGPAAGPATGPATGPAAGPAAGPEVFGPEVSGHEVFGHEVSGHGAGAPA
jgi:phosphocarrier protein